MRVIRNAAICVKFAAIAIGACGCSAHRDDGSRFFGAGGAKGDAGDAGGEVNPPGGGLGALCAGADCDGDGYAAPADCNDEDPQINPEAYDFVGDHVDNDCDGQPDDPIETCETIPTATPGSPTDFARAADLCAQRAMTLGGGVFDPLVSAHWGEIAGYGPGQRRWVSQTKLAQVNIVSSFGANAARRGETMCGFSNGPWGAADPRGSAALDPPGFHLDDACADIPLEGPDCASLSNGAPHGGVSVQDWAELTLVIRVPSNAHAMLFDFAFFSSEYNQFWNASLNDAFLVLVARGSGAPVATNVARDANDLAVTVNSGFFQLCPAWPGPAGLSGDKSVALQNCVGMDGDPARSILGSIRRTGYDGSARPTPEGDDTIRSASGQLYIYGGGSGWLTTTFPVEPREQLTMRIVIFDTFDGLKDSAAIVDSLRWAPAINGIGISRPPR